MSAISSLFFKSVQVQIEIGHRATLKPYPAPNGMTHDWILFVRGQEGNHIENFIEKIVFILHETFPKPRRGMYLQCYIVILYFDVAILLQLSKIPLLRWKSLVMEASTLISISSSKQKKNRESWASLTTCSSILMMLLTIRGKSVLIAICSSVLSYTIERYN